MTSPTPSGPTSPQSDWPEQVAGRIDSVVTSIRDRTTVPITYAARGLVYGIVVLTLAVVLLVLSTIGLVRLLDAYIPIQPLGRRVWVVYAGLSAIFLLAGTFVWRKRRPQGAA